MSVREVVRLTLDKPTSGTAIIALRHVIRTAADLLGLADVEATRVATAASEVGRALADRAEVQLSIAVETGPGATSQLRVGFAFSGGGEVQAQRALRLLVTRLMDSVFVTDGEIVMTKLIPGTITDAQVTAVRHDLLSASSDEEHAPLLSINAELVATLVALREREAELTTLNAELDQTNRGVVALYAELEQRSAEVRNAQRAVFEELEEALRPPPPEVAALDLAVRYIPAQSNSPTGGDLYDWFVLPDGALHVTVVDVRGHGVTSTRDALHVTHAVRTLVLEGHPLDEVLVHADRVLQSAGTEVVATVLLARVDPQTGMVQLAGGGHPPAVHIRTDEPATFIEARGRPLGYEGAGSREVSTAQLARDEVLLLYTDGLIEIRRDIVEGMQTLLDTTTRLRNLPLPRLLDSTLTACAQGARPHDDTLALAVRWTPATA